MAGVKISELPAATTPLVGTEQLALVQSGATKRSTVDSLGAAVGFIQAGTGAVARTAQAKMRDVVSVKDFGAVGDGVADDTAAIQAALNSGAKTVVFPTSATPYFVADVSVPAGVTVDGQHATIKLKPWTGAIGGNFHAFFKSSLTNDICIKNFVMDGNVSAQTADAPNIDRYSGLYFVDCTRLTIENNRFTVEPYGNQSIRVRQGSNVRIRGNFVINKGIYYNAYSGTQYDVTIDYNETNNCGISINDDQAAQTLFGWSISNNKIRASNTLNEVGVGARASNGEIIGNDIQGGYFGITASSGGATFTQHDIIIANNSIIANSGSFSVYGIEHYAKNVVIVGNNLVNCGIVTTQGSGSNVVITGNNMSAPLATTYLDNAISFGAGTYSGVVISGNAANNYGTFINADLINNLSITGNYFQSNNDPAASQFYAYVSNSGVKTVTGLTIENNIVNGAQRGFVYFYAVSGSIAVDRMRVANNSLDANSYILTYFGAVSFTNSIYSPSNNITTAATVTYSASMTPDAILAHAFIITATNATAFTINAPSNGYSGQRISVTIRNTSGGALGAVTWAAAYKLSAWTQPATANSRSIDFRYDGTNWIEMARTPADVPN